MSDEMIDRARRIVDDERNQTHLGKWAEALLAERAKREEAERERDDAVRAAVMEGERRINTVEERAEQLSQQVAGLLSELRAAERERDDARRQVQSVVAESLVPAEARVADLEAALRKARDYIAREVAHAAGEGDRVRAVIDAALREQEARGEVSEGRAGSDTTPVGPISPEGTVTGGGSRPTPLADFGEQEATPPEPDEDYRAWQRAAEAPTVYSQPLPASAPQGEAEPWKWALDATEPAETRGS